MISRKHYPKGISSGLDAVLLGILRTNEPFGSNILLPIRR